MDEEPINTAPDVEPEAPPPPEAPSEAPQPPPRSGATFGSTGASASTFGSGPAYSAPPGPPPGPQFGAPRASFVPPPPPVRDRRGSAWAAFFGGTLLGCGCLPLLAFVLFASALGSMLGGGTVGPRGDSVALIDVSGVITSGEADGGPFSSAGADAQTIIDQLESVRHNKRLKAVVLWINSPGGSAAGSDAVYTEIQKVRTGGTKVVVAMGDVAASGGYYIASAADRIFANGATVTGSIGVISELPNFSNPNGWIKKSGYDEIVVKSGKFKDMGNPMRPMTAEERALFQNMVDDIYNQFLTAVSKARKIDLAVLRPMADGRVFTGRQAVKNGLVDEIGSLRDAISYAGSNSGLGPDPRVYRMSRSRLGRLLGDVDTAYQGALQRKLLGLLLLDPRAASMAREMTTSGPLAAR